MAEENYSQNLMLLSRTSRHQLIVEFIVFTLSLDSGFDFTCYSSFRRKRIIIFRLFLEKQLVFSYNPIIHSLRE